MTEDRRTILIVDDDPDVRATLRLVLERAGYAVVEAEDGETGLRRYREARPDLAIVDLMMEEVDAGTNLVTELRALGPAPPIYLLSSVGDALDATTSAAELGLAGVFQKPVDPATLLTTLRTRLARV